LDQINAALVCIREVPILPTPILPTLEQQCSFRRNMQIVIKLMSLKQQSRVVRCTVI